VSFWKFGLKNGVYAAAVSMFFSGVVLVWPQRGNWVGYILIFSAALLLIWGLTIGRKPWWRKFRTNVSPNQWMKKDDPDAVLERHIIEALAREDVLARGRRVVSQTPYRLTAASEPIPANFWIHAFIQPFGELVINDPGRGAASTDGMFHEVDDRRSYREVVLKRDQVEQIWPKAGSRPAPNVFSTAVERYWQKSQSDPDREFKEAFSLAAAGHLKTDC
jgi:hypothetical protein